MDWIISDSGYNGVDLRLFYADFSPEDWGTCRWDKSGPSQGWNWEAGDLPRGGSVAAVFGVADGIRWER